jgi:hypothetical protein
MRAGRSGSARLSSGDSARRWQPSGAPRRSRTRSGTRRSRSRPPGPSASSARRSASGTIAGCQRAVAAARHVLYRALATGFLGFAYTEKGPGEAERAITALEQSIPLVQKFGLKAYEGWFKAFLAEAHRLARHLERAEELAQDACRTATEARFPVGVGWAQLALGRIAADRDDLEAAKTRLDTALSTFTDARSSYEWARVHIELAKVSRARGADEASRDHLEAARARFVALDVPIHRERVERLAAEWAITLGT